MAAISQNYGWPAMYGALQAQYAAILVLAANRFTLTAMPWSHREVHADPYKKVVHGCCYMQSWSSASTYFAIAVPWLYGSVIALTFAHIYWQFTPKVDAQHN